ncbi:MAG: hypothetical protein ACKOAL_04100, partial [Chthoniobacterales bacterium]
GFCAEQGFDLTPKVMKGSGGKKFPADFVRAVVMEGFGRVAQPMKEKPYLAYNGRFHKRILGNRGNELVPRYSIAANTKNALVPSQRKVCSNRRRDSPRSFRRKPCRPKGCVFSPR